MPSSWRYDVRCRNRLWRSVVARVCRRSCIRKFAGPTAAGGAPKSDGESFGSELPNDARVGLGAGERGYETAHFLREFDPAAFPGSYPAFGTRDPGRT